MLQSGYALKVGDSVFLVNSQAASRFGEGPFLITKLLPHINAVELDEIGSVSISDVGLSRENETAALLEPQSPLSNNVLTSTERMIRVETLAGQLLGSSDTNARYVAREILRLLWEERDS